MIVGLGNVGAAYEHTRHNAGFWFVDALAQRARIHFNAQRKFSGDTARLGQGGNELWLLKPSTYMNRSGIAVAAMSQYYKILPHQILVVHDELDLPPGSIKLKRGGGCAGHNGLKDIDSQLASPDFWRLRIGIGHPRSLGLAQNVADFVLNRPSRDDEQRIGLAIARGLEAIDLLIEGHTQAAANALSAKTEASAAPSAPNTPPSADKRA